MSLDLGTLTGYLALDGKQFDSTLDAIPDKLKGSGAVMGAAAGGVALLVGAALMQGLTSAIDGEAAADKLSASLSLTEAESARIGGVAGKLYRDAYGASIEEVSDSVEAVVSSFDGMRNASGEAVEATTAKLLNLQTAMGIDVARSAQVAGQAVKNGLAGSADEAIDLLTANLQRVPASVREDLLDAVDEYGPILANMGYSGEEAFGMLANAADKGMYGIDKTGDALKELSIRSTDMSAASIAAYQSMGMSAESMSAWMLAGGDSARGATDEIIAGLLGIKDPTAQANAAIALFGTPLEDLGTQEIPTFLDSLAQVGDGFKSTEGAADAMGATLNGNAKTGWVELQRTWEGIVGQVGGALLPVLDVLLSWLNENPAILQVVAGVLGILAAGFMIASVAVWAMNSALLANPITWIILAVVALVAAIVLLIANWDTVVKFLGDTWAGFVGWFTGVMDGFLSWWGGVWDGFMGFLAGVWANVTSTAMAAWNGLIAWLTGIPGWILGVFVGAGQWLLAVGSDIINGARTGLVNGWTAVMSWFNGLPGTILGFFSGAGRWLWDIGRNMINGLLDGIKSLGSTIGNFFLDLLPDWIVGPFKAALGIHSPSRVFRGYGQNLIEGLTLGLNDEQGGLDRRMAGLVGPLDGLEASRSFSALIGASYAAQGPTELRVSNSLAGARIVMDVEGHQFVGIIREQIDLSSEERRGELIDQAGSVVFS